MIKCPDCGSEIAFDDDDYEIGETQDCLDCGAYLIVTQLNPLKFEIDEDEGL
jgi:lysine biosynthesis protein LysW